MCLINDMFYEQSELEVSNNKKSDLITYAFDSCVDRDADVVVANTTSGR